MKNTFKKIKNIKLKNKEKILIAITLSVVGITTIALIIWKATSGKVQNEESNEINKINLAKQNSIKEYGDLKTAIVTLNESNELQFTVGTKEAIKESVFNAQITIQDSTFVKTTLQGYTENKNKKDSFDTYGNLFASDASIEVDFEEGNYTFQIGENTKIIGIDVLNAELDNQGDQVMTSYTIENLNSENINILNFNTENKTLENAIASAKQSSIDQYGNLFADNASIKVDYNGTNYTFQIDDKDKIIGINSLNTQLNYQKSDALVLNYTIQNLIVGAADLNFDDNQTLVKAKEKKDSIDTYGHFDKEDVWLDSDGTNFFFQIKTKIKMTQVTFDAERIKQNTQKGLQEILKTERFLSFEEYGNLFAENVSIKVDYEDKDYTFQIDDNTQIIGIDSLNVNLNIQKPDTNPQNYNFEQIEDINIQLENKEEAIAKKNSINLYGYLHSHITRIKFDYNGTNYTFQIGENTKIIGFTNLNTELNKQDLNRDNYNFDKNSNDIDLPEDDVFTFTKAKNKANEEIVNNQSATVNSLFLYNKSFQTNSNALYLSFFTAIILFVILSWILFKKFFIKKGK